MDKEDFKRIKLKYPDIEIPILKGEDLDYKKCELMIEIYKLYLKISLQPNISIKELEIMYDHHKRKNIISNLESFKRIFSKLSWDDNDSIENLKKLEKDMNVAILNLTKYLMILKNTQNQNDENIKKLMNQNTELFVEVLKIIEEKYLN